MCSNSRCADHFRSRALASATRRGRRARPLASRHRSSSRGGGEGVPPLVDATTSPGRRAGDDGGASCDGRLGLPSYGESPLWTGVMAGALRPGGRGWRDAADRGGRTLDPRRRLIQRFSSRLPRVSRIDVTPALDRRPVGRRGAGPGRRLFARPRIGRGNRSIGERLSRPSEGAKPARRGFISSPLFGLRHATRAHGDSTLVDGDAELAQLTSCDVVRSRFRCDLEVCAPCMNRTCARCLGRCSQSLAASGI
jgi:hypothetical protein